MYIKDMGVGGVVRLGGRGRGGGGGNATLHKLVLPDVIFKGGRVETSTFKGDQAAADSPTI